MSYVICANCQREIASDVGKDHTAECLVTPDGIVNSSATAAAWRAGVRAAHKVQRILKATGRTKVTT